MGSMYSTVCRPAEFPAEIDEEVKHRGYRHSAEFNIRAMYEQKKTKHDAVRIVAERGYHIGPGLYLYKSECDPICHHKHHKIITYKHSDKMGVFITRVVACLTCDDILDVCQYEE